MKVKMFPHIFLLLLTGKSEKCECSAFRFDFQLILLSKLDGFLCFFCWLEHNLHFEISDICNNTSAVHTNLNMSSEIDKQLKAIVATNF